MTSDSASTSAPDRPTAAAKVADAATLVLLAIVLWMILVARPPGLFAAVGEILSPSSLIYLAACVQIVRHLMWPRPSALSSLQVLRSAILNRPHFAAALRAFLVTRPAVFVVAFIAVVTIGLTSTPGFVLSRDPLANLPARFDAGWYGGIALDGYNWDHTFQRQRNIAFFPALPLLMRPVGAVLGMYEEGPSRERRMLRGLWAGTVISLAAFFWALYYVSRLADELLGPERAPAAALLLAAYPFSVYYSAPYTESLFLLGSAGACYHFLRRDRLAASAWGILAGLSRPNGCFLVAPLAILALQKLGKAGENDLEPRNGRASASKSLQPSPSAQREATATEGGAPGAAEKSRALRAMKKDDTLRIEAKGFLMSLVVASMPVVGMIVFTLYLYQLTGGVWFAWARSHEAWGRSYEGFAPVLLFAGRLWDEPFLQLIVNNPFNAINAAGVVFALALTYPVFRRLGLAWGVFVLINLLPPLLAGGLLSLGRLTSTLFPLFLALAALLPARAVPGCAAMFGIGQGIAAALFFTWRALY